MPDNPSEIVYAVPRMSCERCERAVTAELRQVPGVAAVEVDLAARRVTVRGAGLADAALRGAIEDAGYEAEAA